MHVSSPKNLIRVVSAIFLFQRALSDMEGNHAKYISTVKQWMFSDAVFELTMSFILFSSKEWVEGAVPTAFFKTVEA